jgi:hypothetical protein
MSPERRTSCDWWQLVGSCCDFSPFSRCGLATSDYVFRLKPCLKPRLGTCVDTLFSDHPCYQVLYRYWSVYGLSWVIQMTLHLRYYSGKKMPYL